MALQKVLEDAGFDTTVVWTAKEFLDAIRSEAFDLVLVHEYMPGASCQELFQVIREAQLRCMLLRATRSAASERIALGEQAVESACKHDYVEIVRLVNDILLSGEKQISAARGDQS